MASDDLYRTLFAGLDQLAAGRSCDRSKAVAALRAVVELHAPIEQRNYSPKVWLECGHCREDEPDNDGYVDHADWPCSTIRTAAEALGVTEGDRP